MFSSKIIEKFYEFNSMNAISVNIKNKHSTVVNRKIQ